MALSPDQTSNPGIYGPTPSGHRIARGGEILAVKGGDVTVGIFAVGGPEVSAILVLALVLFGGRKIGRGPQHPLESDDSRLLTSRHSAPVPDRFDGEPLPR